MKTITWFWRMPVQLIEYLRNAESDAQHEGVLFNGTVSYKDQDVFEQASEDLLKEVRACIIKKTFKSHWS